MSLWYDEVWDGKTRTGYRVERVVFSERSEYQHVEIVETSLLGRVLVIDGIFMTDEREDYFYHEMIAHPALVTAPRIERVLIVGGGDGGTAREVLRHPGVRHVTMIEIDRLVIEACREHLPALGAWDDPRLHVRIGDGVKFVQTADTAPFDVVLLDGTDPIGPGEGLFGVDFYRGVRRVLAPGGVFVLQSESPILMPELFVDIVGSLRGLFARATPYFGPVPLYGAGNWSWTYCADAADPLAVDGGRLAAIEAGCRYYNRDIHASAFAAGNNVRRLLGELA